MKIRTLIQKTTDEILENTTERLIPEDPLMNRYATVSLLRDKFFEDCKDVSLIDRIRYRIAFQNELRSIVKNYLLMICSN